MKQGEIMTSICQMCGSGQVDVKIVPKHVEDLIGIKVGVVNCVENVVCKECGEKITIVPDANGLIAATATARIMLPTKLNGAEIKFLRKAIGLQAKEVAQIMDLRPETISRWECDDSQKITSSVEKLFRILVGFNLKQAKEDKAPGIDFDEKTILSMKINPLREVSDAPFLNFGRINIKIDKKKQKAWEEINLAA